MLIKISCYWLYGTFQDDEVPFIQAKRDNEESESIFTGTTSKTSWDSDILQISSKTNSSLITDIPG